jgi:hypothetical protein
MFHRREIVSFRRAFSTSRRLSMLAGVVLAVVLSSTAFGEDSKQVGLVIRWSDGSELTEIVNVPIDATGLDVLLASSAEATTYDAGWGISVCAIDGEGCPEDDCFCDPDHFWGYWHLAGAGWESSLTGAAEYVPADGDVEGFAWTGFDENFNPTVTPPVYTFEEIEAQQAPTDIPEPSTLLLVAGGLSGLAAYARRRRRV